MMKKLFSLLVAATLCLPHLVLAGEQEPWERRSAVAEKWFFKDLPRHIGSDFKQAFWNGPTFLLLPVAAGVVAGLHSEDSEIQSSFQRERPLGKTVDDILNIGANPILLGGVSLITLVVAELVESKKAAVAAGTMLEALFLTEALTFGLKFATQRRRPDGSDSLSFPSGHASGAFALASVTTVLYGPWAGVPAYAVATLAGLSRIDSNTHFASDVAAGALLGTLIGLGTARFHKGEFAKWLVAPAAGDGSVGIAFVHPF